MADSTKTPLEIMYEELIYFVAKSIDLEYIYCGERPDKTPAKLSQFVVIDIPIEIKDDVCGNSNFALNTTGFIYVFCRSKSDRTINQSKQSSLAYAIKRTFPLSAEHITATKPRFLPGGYDGNGFYISTLSFNLRSKLNAFSNS